MARYAGKLAGMYPEDLAQALKCDEVMDICLDALGKCPSPPDADEKKRLREEYAAGRLKEYTALLDSRLAGPFVLGDAVCVADFVLYYFLVKMLRDGQFDHVPADYCDAFPKLVSFEAAMAVAPAIVAWQTHRAGPSL